MKRYIKSSNVTNRFGERVYPDKVDIDLMQKMYPDATYDEIYDMLDESDRYYRKAKDWDHFATVKLDTLVKIIRRVYRNEYTVEQVKKIIEEDGIAYFNYEGIFYGEYRKFGNFFVMWNDVR